MTDIIFGKYLFLTWCFLGLLLYPHTSQAELRYSFLCQDVSRCSALAHKARTFSKQDNWQEAQRIYKRLYATWPDPNLAFDYARVLERQDRFQEALPYYLTCIHSPFCLPELQVLARNRVGASHPLPGSRGPDPDFGSVRNRSDPVGTMRNAAPVDSSVREPLHKRWWFWGVLGITLSTITLGASFGVYFKRPDGDPPRVIFR